MDIKYVVLPQKRMVKAIAVCNTKYAEGIKDEVGDMLVSCGVNPSKIKITRTVAGTSKAHPDDVFDVEIGKQIARDRLLVKYNEQLISANTYCKEQLENLVIKNTRKISSCTRKCSNATNRLER